MVVRELAAADLGDDVLLDLIRTDDPIGVLSIDVDGSSTATDRGAVIDIKNRLVELERSVQRRRADERLQSLASAQPRRSRRDAVHPSAA